MAKKLIIVESPTKIKTLKKFLGREYVIESSVGHIRDLPKKGFGIDFDNKFEPTYETLPDKKDVIAKLKKAAKTCDEVYLAPDPDREGEAIAWHIAEILPKQSTLKRVTFNAITKEAVTNALKNPRKIDQALVDAQQARRILDRIVGYSISPILQRRIRKAQGGFLSAGRVQSVALKFVVDREKEIEAFVPLEYWNISSILTSEKKAKQFEAFLVEVDGEKIDKNIPNEKAANKIVARLEKAKYHVGKVTKKEKKRNPVPPFITSSLQQEASRHHGFSAQRTMSIAQSLYEGVDLGQEGTEGLITYMRTDSVRVEPEAISTVRKYIKDEYGGEYVPDKPRAYSTKKSAQDAHEAIRPTNLFHPPEMIQSHLNPDQFKLYTLIWRRFVASQMASAIYDTISCDINTDQEIGLRVTGSRVKFKGYLAAYSEKSDEDAGESKEQPLPDLFEGQELDLKEVLSAQAFTKPPPRYTEASLVKELEKSGIGRPSTYATIMNKIQSRDYTIKEKLYLRPTELGRIIAAMLDAHFQMIMDVSFTAKMEDELDDIAEKKIGWRDFMQVFWDKFDPMIKVAEKEAFVPKVDTDIDCPECGKKLQKIWSRGKYFYGCSNYPDCTFASPIEGLTFDRSAYRDDFDWEQKCPKCQGEMKIRHGKFGAFLGCANYPKCRGIVNIPKKGEKSLDEMPDCPAIGCDGKITQRRTRFGKPFFSCTNYPDCDVIVNEIEDLSKKYPDHPKTAYVKKKGGGRGKKKPSKALAVITGTDPLTRGDVTKKIWAYIKKNNLQDPSNKRNIVPDDTLAAIFGSKTTINMFQLASIISQNLE